MGALGKIVAAKGFKKCNQSPDLVTLATTKQNKAIMANGEQGALLNTSWPQQQQPQQHKNCRSPLDSNFEQRIGKLVMYCSAVSASDNSIYVFQTIFALFIFSLSLFCLGNLNSTRVCQKRKFHFIFSHFFDTMGQNRSHRSGQRSHL